MKTTISVIVPVYNIATKVRKCIQSILAQSFQNFELIVVDDGSRDGSGEICDEFIGSRIKVIHKENAGVTQARACGVENASGEWIYFVDGDDMLPEGALQALLDASQDSDIVIARVVEMYPNEINNMLTPPLECKQKDSGVFSEAFICGLLEHKMTKYPYGRLFKRALFDENTFDIPREINRGEDYIMNVRLGRNAKRICMIPNVVYYYIQYPESVSHSFKYSWQYETLFDLYLKKSFEAHEISVYRDSIAHAHIRQLLSGLADRELNIGNSFFRQIVEESKEVTLSRKEKLLIAFARLPFPLRKNIYFVLKRMKNFIKRK